MSGILRTTIPVGALQCNCTILVDDETRESILIDPGDEAPSILAAIEAANARPVALLHTHAHFDHIGASSAVAEATGAAIRLHEADRFLWDALPSQAAMFGLQAQAPRDPDAALAHGETITFGKSSLRVIHTPGHTPGSSCFLLDSDTPVLYAGDTLFRRSIGRTDLWGGDGEQILDSIRERLYSLPDDTPVVCGHGPNTTIGEERQQNPFVRR